MNSLSRIAVFGANGMLGRAMVDLLYAQAFFKTRYPSRQVVDLTKWDEVKRWFDFFGPEYVFMMAGKVGGIIANQNEPVEFLEQNAQMAVNVIRASAMTGVQKLVYTSSSCAYPKHAGNPISEESLLCGPMEPTNRPYALAKILGMELCASYCREYGKNFVCTMPTNLYGPGDHYSVENSHVLPGMMTKIHAAKLDSAAEVVLWGTGTPIREFLHSVDCARAHLSVMEDSASAGVTNLGGEKICLRDLAAKIAKVVGYTGTIVWDTTKPDGTPDRQLDNNRALRAGFTPLLTLTDTLPGIYSDFLNQLKHQ